MNDDQIWKWIPGYEGRYAVSNRGRVYMMDAYLNGRRSGT